MIAAFAVAAMASPSIAADKSEKKPEIFIMKAQKIIDGERQITAVREDGKKTALVKVNQQGEVTATVDGKPVNAVLKGL